MDSIISNIKIFLMDVQIAWLRFRELRYQGKMYDMETKL